MLYKRYNHILLMDEMQWLIWSSVRCNAEFGNNLTDGQALAQWSISTHTQGRLYLYNIHARAWMVGFCLRFMVKVLLKAGRNCGL